MGGGGCKIASVFVVVSSMVCLHVLVVVVGGNSRRSRDRCSCRVGVVSLVVAACVTCFVVVVVAAADREWF